MIKEQPVYDMRVSMITSTDWGMFIDAPAWFWFIDLDAITGEIRQIYRWRGV